MSKPSLLAVTLFLSSKSREVQSQSSKYAIVKETTAGRRHTCALLTDDSLKCWGRNSFGQLGLSDTYTRGSTPFEMGNALPSVTIGTKSKIITVTAGSEHTCVYLEDGSTRCWGRNDYGQLGLGDTDNRGDSYDDMSYKLPHVDLLGSSSSSSSSSSGATTTMTKLYTGGFHNCATFSDGSLKCWGRNDYGQLGLGDTLHRGVSPSQMGSDLPVVDVGNNESVKHVALGAYHTCVTLRSDDGVRCWGQNDYGQLGLGYVSTQGTTPKSMGNGMRRVDLGTNRTVVSLTSNFYHNCAILDDGSVKCWGRNDFGQLGIGDADHRGDDFYEMGDRLPSVDLGISGNVTVEYLAGGGGYHTCAVLGPDSALKCWGGNNVGQLGLGDNENRGDGPGEMGGNLTIVNFGSNYTATRVTLGYTHSCVIVDDGALKCWGRNIVGQLGYGDSLDRGLSPDLMGDELPAVDLTSSFDNVAELNLVRSGASCVCGVMRITCISVLVWFISN